VEEMMIPTNKQCDDFISCVIPREVLHDTFDWIQENMNPEDVFDYDTLRHWAEENGFVVDSN
jgi:hypothetical protein